MAIAAAVGVYAVVHHPTWEASQALIVRNEASGAERTPGKFSYPEEMKTVQETILEVVKSRGVLEAALREVGPPADGKDPAAWPTDRDIDEARKNVKLAPPKGAEFGKTEVFYLDVRAEDRARSVALNEAIFKQLRVQFQKLRDAKAQSMVDEADQDRPPGQGRPGRGHRRVGGDREPRGQRPGRTALDAGHGLQRQRPAPQRRGHPHNSARTPRRKRSIGNCSPW